MIAESILGWRSEAGEGRGEGEGGAGTRVQEGPSGRCGTCADSRGGGGGECGLEGVAHERISFQALCLFPALE